MATELILLLLLALGVGGSFFLIPSARTNIIKTFNLGLLIAEFVIRALFTYAPIVLKVAVGWLVAASLIVSISVMTGNKWGLIIALVPTAVLMLFVSQIAEVAARVFQGLGGFGRKVADAFGIQIAPGAPVDLGIAKGLYIWSYSLIFYAMVGLLLVDNIHLSREASWMLGLGILFIAMTLSQWKGEKWQGWKVMTLGVVLMVAIVIVPEILNSLSPNSYPSVLTSMQRLTKAGVNRVESLVRGGEKYMDPNSPIEVQEAARDYQKTVIAGQLKLLHQLIQQEKDQVIAGKVSRADVEGAIKKIRARVEEIQSLQQDLKKLDEEPQSAQSSGWSNSWWWPYAGVLGIIVLLMILLSLLPKGRVHKTFSTLLAVALAVVILLAVMEYDNRKLRPSSSYGYAQESAGYVAPSGGMASKPVILPTDVAGQVKAAADKHGAPYELVAAICWQESGCNPSIKDGRSGEIGPMQILPDTAAKFGVTASQLRDPAVNFDTGARLIKSYLDKYGPNRPDLVALAYNAGEGKADQYISVPFEQIPPAELQGINSKGVAYNSHAYVKGVINFNGAAAVASFSLTAEPPTPAGWEEAKRGLIPVTQPWTSVGRFQGEVMVITWGTAVLHKFGFQVDPDGWTDLADGSYPVPGERVFCLLVKTNTTIQKAGRRGYLELPTEQDLTLGPNEDPGGFGDNRGGWPYKVLTRKK